MNKKQEDINTVTVCSHAQINTVIYTDKCLKRALRTTYGTQMKIKHFNDFIQS